MEPQKGLDQASVWRSLPFSSQLPLLLPSHCHFHRLLGSTRSIRVGLGFSMRGVVVVAEAAAVVIVVVVAVVLIV